MSELNRCPCGGKAHANEIVGGWMISCCEPQCGFEAVRDTREEAVSAWNARPAEDDLRARIAELEVQLCGAYERAAVVAETKAKAAADNANEGRLMKHYELSMTYDRVEEALEAVADEIRGLTRMDADA